MKKNKLFTLFSLTLLSMGTPLTSIAQVVAVSQDTPAITTVSSEETEKPQDLETKPETTDEDKTGKAEAEAVTTEQEKTEQKSDKKETETKATDTPKNETITPSDKNAKAETPKNLKTETLVWGDAPYTFDSDTGILTINSGTLDKPENAPWKLTDERKIDAEKIKKISFTGATKAPVNSRKLFKALKKLTEIDGLTNLDTSDVTNMDEMFYDCYALKNLDLSNFNTEKVTSIVDMFFYCVSLESLDLSKFDTKNMTDMTGLFKSCKRLKTLDLSGFNTLSKPTMLDMFNETVLSSLTLGDEFRFFGDDSNLPKPAALTPGVALTGKWIKKNRGSYPQSPGGFMRQYGKNELTAGTYVAEIKAPLLWGDAPYTFDENTGTLTIESGRLFKSDTSPWKRDDDEKIDGTKIKKIILTGPVLAPENATNLFRQLSNLTEIEGLTYLDTSETTAMLNMFCDATSLTSLDLSQFNTKNVSDIRGMFSGCVSLKSLDLSSFDTSAVKRMNQLLENVSLASLTLGDNFKFLDTNISLSKPRSLLSKSELQREGNYLTGNWIKKDNQSAAYAPDSFMTNYGKGDLKAGTYVAEIQPLLWGYASWSFDSTTGILTIGPGNLDKTENAPWKRNDDKKIAEDNIKKIVFTGATKAPENAEELFKALSNLTEIAGVTNLDTSDVTTMLNMFRDCSNLVTLDLSNFNTEKVTDTRDMFRNCTSLTTLDLSKFNTKNVKDMRGMFRDCTSFKSLDLSSFDTSAVTEMNKLFENVPLVSLTLGDNFKFVGEDSNLRKPLSSSSASDLKREGKYLTGNWIKKDNQSAAYSTEKFTANYGKGDLNAGTYVAETGSLLWGDAPWSFDNTTGILTIGPGNLDKPDNAPWKRNDDKKIAGDKIKKIVFTGATKAPVNSTDLFKSLKNLTEINGLTNLDTSDVSNMTRMFDECTALTALDLSNFNTAKVTSMLDMFLFCTSLTSLDLKSFNTKNVKDMRGMFRGSSSLINLDLTSLDTSNVSQMGGMFKDITLISLTLGDRFKFVNTDSNLRKPRALASTSELLLDGKYLTGNWIKKDDQSAPYTPDDFITHYGKGDLKAGTYVSEIKILTWGDAPWGFDNATGTLTINSGTLDETDNSPWKRNDAQKIAGDKIKKIVFTGATKAPVNSTDLFKSLKSLTEIEALPYLDTSDVSNMTRMFDECTALTALDLSNFNTEEVKSMLDMFLFCTSLTSLDLKSFNTKNVNDMRGMFRGSSSLISLDLASLDMSNVSQMGGMFKDISLVSLTLGDAFKFDNPNSNLRKPRAIVSVSDLNREGKYLTDNWIKKEDSSLVYTTADFMANYGKGDLKAGTYVAEIKPLIWGDAPYRFDSNTGVLTINSGTLGEAESAPWNKTDNSKVAGEKIKKIVFTGETKVPVNATALFKSLKNLTEIEALPNLDTSDVSNMSRMFEGCSALTTLDLSNFNTEKVTSMLDMFLFCGSLTTLDLKSFNTKNVTDMRGMFRACSSLKSLNLSNFDTSNGSLMGGMFTETVLSSLTLGDKFKFRGDGINLPEPAALATGDKLTGKWIKMNRGSYPYSPNGFMREYGKKDLTAGTYVAEIKAPLLWGDAPYTFDKNTGVLTVESGRLSKSDASPWNKEGDEKIAGEKIKKIVFTAATKAPEDSTDLFKDLNNLTEIAGLTNLDTSEVTSMYNLFRDCSSLMTFDISNFSTSKLTNTRDMFRGCTSLLTLDLSTFNTKNINDMRGMFRTCTSLNTLDISALDTSSVSTLTLMFEDVPLASLTLGDNFRFVTTDSHLSLLQEKSKLAALREGNYLTGNWIKKDNPSPVYTTKDFTTNYGKTAGLQAGTYVAETKPVFWGDAPYAFDSDTGVLTVNPGTLDQTTKSPWNREDYVKINANLVKKIIFTGKNKAPKNANRLFADLTSLKEIIGLDKFDTSQIQDANFMFTGSTMLESLDLSNWDTSNIIAYGGMFENCRNLKKLDISSFIIPPRDTWDLSSIRIFRNCDSLASLTLGDKFALHSGMELSDPKVLHSWERPTGNWIRKDGNSKAYSTKNFVANYGKGDLTAGTYIAEVKPIKWGSALWTFDPDSGILTVNSGTLEAGSTTSPWKRTDGQNIDPNSVKQIVFTGKTQAPKNSEALFSDLPNLTDIVNLTNLDTSKVTDMSRMFIGCKSLKTLDLSQFNTSNVTKTEWMFQDCASLAELNLKSFDTSKLTKMWMMFSGCASLTSLDLSNFDTKSVVTMGKLFYGCSSLTSVNLSSFDTSQVTHMGEMFQNCTSLTSLDLSSFDTGKVTTMQKLFKNTPLASLTLGVKFKSVGRDADLPIPTALNDGDKLTGNWIRKDGQSKAYSPANFMANYGKGDLQAGTYVGELISSGAVLETTISFSTDSGKTAATTADIGDKLQGKITVKHTADSPKDAIASVIKLSTISLLTDAWAVLPTVTVTTFDQDGKQTATKAQTIKDNELSLPALPFDSYIEITITGTAWEKAYAIPNGNYHYTLSHQNQFGVQKVEKSDNFVINSGAFGFKSVPNISFTDSILPIKSNQFIDRKDADYALSVTDYRGTRLPDGETVKPDRVNWEITATASPFKDATGKTIKLSTMAVSFTKVIGQTTELGADATLITSHDVTGETAKDNHLTKLSWAKELGFKAIVHNRSGLDTTKYTADVEFDLRTAP